MEVEIQKRQADTSIMQKLFSTLILILVFVLLGLSGVYYIFNNSLKPVVGSSQGFEKVITVPKGSNSKQIGQLLADQGLINSALTFRFYSMFKHLDGQLKAGEYRFSKGMSTPEIAKRLIIGETSSLSFTIPEGFTLKQIVDRLEQKKIINKSVFMKLISNGEFKYDFLQGLPEGPNRLEGYLFPDTYKISSKTTERQIIDIMLARFAKEITPEFIAKAAKLELTVHQAVILASIIEREAQKEEERPKVAAVFLNRLRKGWKLESCATVQYALGKNKERLFDTDLLIDSPYNTYKYYGLPAGPISCPGGSSLQAAVNPANVDYMFFVVYEDGKHIFSRTLKEHIRNKALYLKRLKAAKQ